MTPYSTKVSIYCSNNNTSTRSTEDSCSLVCCSTNIKLIGWRICSYTNIPTHIVYIISRLIPCGSRQETFSINSRLSIVISRISSNPVIGRIPIRKVYRSNLSSHTSSKERIYFSKPSNKSLSIKLRFSIIIIFNSIPLRISFTREKSKRINLISTICRTRVV